MYLREFTKEEQGAFLKLAYTMIIADKKLAKEEFEIFQAYSVEIGEAITMGESQINVLDELKILQNMPKDKKRKMYFELLAVATVDGIFTIEEKDVMGLVQKEFALTNMETQELAASLEEVKKAHKKLEAIINQ